MKREETGQSWATSILLLLVALVCATAATTAWFTIADRTKVHNFGMDVTTGPAIRFDLDAHGDFMDYVQTLSFTEIATRIHAEKGFDPRTTAMEPVTTDNYRQFRLEDETTVDPREGFYLEFTLHFIATEDVWVHLSSANSEGMTDGTLVASKIRKLPNAMRLSFTDGDTTYVYDPGMGAGSTTAGKNKIFGLPGSTAMVYNNDNAMFWLYKGQDKPIQVHLWVEGKDEACDDEIQAGDFQIRLRFEATDENHQVILTGYERSKASTTEKN